jgi:predicted acyl esterase
MRSNYWLKSRLRYLIGVLFLVALWASVAAAQEKAEAPSPAVKIILGARIPMRDGVTLSANIFRPDKSGKFPVIILRTPYGKNSASQFGYGRFFAEKDYVYIVEDSRGRHDSDGIFHAMHDEAEDGYDTIEWAASQPWSDGNVGTFGGSYGGENQWMAATCRPPHLKTMAVLVSPPGPFYNIPFQYGALTLLMLDWTIGTTDHTGQRSSEFGLEHVIRKLPLVTLDELTTGRPIRNTGHPFGMDSEMRVARQTVFHDAKYPSHIVLPVIPAKTKEIPHP